MEVEVLGTRSNDYLEQNALPPRGAQFSVTLGNNKVTFVVTGSDWREATIEVKVVKVEYKTE